MLAPIDDLVKLLREHPLVKSVRVVDYDKIPSGKLVVKIRCRLIRNYKLQVWLHNESTFQDYAYQLFTDHPILRWDNAPHYPNISTAPDHFHNELGNVSESPLLGNPLKDLKNVLTEIEKWITYTGNSTKKSEKA